MIYKVPKSQKKSGRISFVGALRPALIFNKRSEFFFSPFDTSLYFSFFIQSDLSLFLLLMDQRSLKIVIIVIIIIIIWY